MAAQRYSFTDFQVHNPASPPPGDRLDGEYARGDKALSEITAQISVSLAPDGTLKPSIVGKTQLQPGLFDTIVATAEARVEGLVAKAVTSAGQGEVSTRNALILAGTASVQNALAQDAAARSSSEARDAASSAAEAAGSALDAAASANDASNDANHADGAAALAEDWGRVSVEWAEHMPDTIPPNILAVMGISGDHWSSRWWANRAAALFDENHLGPPGPTGPQGPQGPQGPPGTGSVSGMVAGQIPIAATATGIVSSANLSGDVASAPTTLVTTLRTVNANVGTFQGAFTVNAKGLVTAAGAKYHALNVVDDFGADPTGAADCTAAFNAGIAAAAALYIPEGHYRFNANLAPVVKTGFRLFGAGAVISILEFYSTTGDLISIGDGTGNPADVTLEGIGVVAMSTRTGGAAIRIRNGHNITVRDFYTYGVGGSHYDGVVLDGGPQGFIYNVSNFVLSTGANAGILWQNTPTDTSVCDGVISGFKNGLKLFSASGYFLNNLDIINSTDVGILFSPPTGANVAAGYLNAVLSDTSNGDNWRFESAGTGYTAYLTATNCWGSTSGTTAGAGFNFNDPRSRLLSFSNSQALNNKHQGVVINAGSEIFFGNGSFISLNSQAGSGLYDGIYVAAGVSAITLNGFVSGGAPGDPGGGAGQQRYGLYIAAGAGDYINVDNCQLQGNATGTWFLGATGSHNIYSSSGTMCLGGSVAIGTTAAQASLEIRDLGWAAVKVQSAASVGAGGWLGYEFAIGSDNEAYITNYENAGIHIATDNAERMTVSAAGNVGIGTTAPSAKFHVAATGDTISTLFSGISKGLRVGFTSAATIIEGVDNSGFASFQPLTIGGSQLTFANNGTDAARLTGGSLGVGTLVPQGRVHAASLVTAGSTPPIVAGIGPNGVDTTSILVHLVDGGYNFTCGTITRNVLGVLFNTSSDARLKQNPRPSERGLDLLLRIKVEDFAFKRAPGLVQQGMRAQALHKIYPEAVHVGGDDPDMDPWGIDYGRLMPLAIRAMQQQQAQINDLERRLAAVEAR